MATPKNLMYWLTYKLISLTIHPMKNSSKQETPETYHERYLEKQFGSFTIIWRKATMRCSIQLQDNTSQSNLLTESGMNWMYSKKAFGHARMLELEMHKLSASEQKKDLSL